MRARPNDRQENAQNVRAQLIGAVRRFVKTINRSPGIIRIALIGSLTTDKPHPKDADLLVTIKDGLDLTSLARAGRRLQGFAQSLNRGADIFLADKSGAYLGRICHWRECHPRVACKALNCGHRDHLNDDLQVVTLKQDLIAAPPVELWPVVRRRVIIPADVETLLLAKLENHTDSHA